MDDEWAKGECILFSFLVWNWCWRKRGRIEGGSRGPSWKSIERRKKPEEQEESRPVERREESPLSSRPFIQRWPTQEEYVSRARIRQKKVEHELLERSGECLVFIPGLLRKRPPYRWMLTNRRLSDFFYLSPGICTPDAPGRYRSSFAFFLFSYPRRPATLLCPLSMRENWDCVLFFLSFSPFPSSSFSSSEKVCLVIITQTAKRNRNCFVGEFFQSVTLARRLV